MLVHKELVDKVYEYQNMVRELEKIEKDIESYVLKSANLSLENETVIWQEIQNILNESATSHDPELAIAKLDLMIAQMRVKKLMKKSQDQKPENIVLFDKAETN